MSNSPRPPVPESPRPDPPIPESPSHDPPASPRPDSPRPRVSPSPLRILLVDDNRLMLEGLANLLDAHGVQVAGMAKDGLEAVALARSLKPDLILMDIRMPRCDGLAATRQIKAEMPEAKIVILTTSTEDQDLFESVKSGATGYLLKSMDAAELVECLEQAQQGIPPFSPGLAELLLREFARLSENQDTGTERHGEEDTVTALKNSAERHGENLTRRHGEKVSVSPHLCVSASSSPVPESPCPHLTERQSQVLTLVAQGLSYKEVGARLNLSPRTIKYHMAEIMARLHLEHRAQVLAYAGKMMR